MDGRTLKQIIAARVPDDAAIVHLWDGGIAWRQGGIVRCFSFLPDRLSSQPSPDNTQVQ